MHSSGTVNCLHSINKHGALKRGAVKTLSSKAALGVSPQGFNFTSDKNKAAEVLVDAKCTQEHNKLQGVITF